jgi:ankyrin repeat protein
MPYPSSRKPQPGELLQAVNDSDYSAVRRIVEQSPDLLEERDYAGNTPLNRAAAFGYTDIVRYLLEKGADIDSRNKHGETPLISTISSYGNNREVVTRLLLEKGANMDIRNTDGKTAMAIATDRSRVSLIDILKAETTKRKRLALEFAKVAEEKRRAEVAARQDALREEAARRRPTFKPAKPKPPNAA